MGSALRKARTFSLDADLLSEVERTKGTESASERVNNLLRRALEMERRAKLDEEVADFFKQAPEERAERRAYQRANLKTWMRE